MSLENTQSNSKSKSIIINLEELKSRYNNLLIQYKQAVANYVNYLKNNSNQTSSNLKFINMQGQAFWGTSGITSFNTNSIDTCQATCASTPGCTGATFNPDKQSCWIQTGDGPVIPAMANDYAIVPEGNYLINVVDSINKQLISINEQIISQIDEGEPEYNRQAMNRDYNKTELEIEYQNLLNERNKIKKMVRDYENLNSAEQQGSIMINKNYSSYIFFILISCIIIFIIYKISSPSVSSSLQRGGELGINVYYIVLAIIIIIVIVQLYKHYFSL